MEEFIKYIKETSLGVLESTLPDEDNIKLIACAIINELSTQFSVIYDLCIENKRVPEKYKELSDKTPEIKEICEAIYTMSMAQITKSLIYALMDVETSQNNK